MAPAQLVAPCSHPLSSLPAPVDTISTGINWKPLSGAWTVVPFRSLLDPSVGPTGGYNADRKPIAEVWSTLSNGAETDSCESFTRSGWMPAIRDVADEET